MRKLLKYDLRSMSTMFIISTISVLAFAVLGTFCTKIITKYDDLDLYFSQLGIIRTFAGIGLFLTVAAFAAYCVLIAIFVLKRFYTHLYTDQGYLTFTLPVKRREIFGAKLIFALIYVLLAEITVGLGAFIIGLFGKNGVFINQDMLNTISEIFKSGYETFGGYFIAYIIECIILWITGNALAVLIAYTCITVGAMIVKKYKIVAGIGIYYGLNAVFAPIFWIVLVALIDSNLWNKISLLATVTQNNVFALLLMLAIACTFGVCAVLCGFNTYLIRKKINIA